MESQQLMRLALEKARQGIAAGQTPFGCAIARGDEVLACTHNTVLEAVDITAHAEVNAVRAACRRAGDILLDGAIVATTCEPCPMCMAALHWARVETVYYGAAIDDARQAGFSELSLPAGELLRQGGSRVKLIPDMLAEECRALLRDWQANPQRQAY